MTAAHDWPDLPGCPQHLSFTDPIWAGPTLHTQVAMTRLNVRIRQRLFGALMRQDAGFFDQTKTGEITSR